MKSKYPSILLAGKGHAAEVMSLYRSCITKMNHEGLYNWTGEYPDYETIISDILQENLYIFKEKVIKGVISITVSQPAQYLQVDWENVDLKVVVMRRLAVAPDFQGMGIAMQLISYAEKTVARKGYSSIRLDVYSLNSGAIKLYLMLGYKARGEFKISGLEQPFVAMEKILV